MSHISRIEIDINDLGCLRKACQRLDLLFMEGQRTYRWYGRLVQPEKTPLPEGLTQDDLGRCHHAIKVPGAEYEIGVYQQGQKYLLLADFWDSKLKLKIGVGGGLLKQAYAVERTVSEARRRNYRVTVQKSENGIRLILTA